MALSLVLHGLAVLPLFLIAGTLGSTSQEPALFIEFSVAAPTVGANAEPDGAPAEETPSPPELPAPTLEAAVQPPEPPAPLEAAIPPPESPLPLEKIPEPDVVPEIRVDLPPPEEPPPLKVTDLKPVEPPKVTPPKPAPPKPAAPRPTAKPTNVARAATAPDAGNTAVTQQATTAPGESIVWEGRPRYRIPPKPAIYPPRAVELGQQGEVLVRVRLEPDGTAAEIRLWRSSGFSLLDRAALAAVHDWHFHPAMRGGRPVAAWVEIPVRFHLH
ncbi:MAG: energy transducer TonB [Reyranella sp.]|nr:energy transducer TonB [Reyranella sp.]